ncbi:hypothetical protein E4U41_001063 [Claviceps citrina]|nr:hypothetical protein E4U41_001063 [Claviceps citrina]
MKFTALLFLASALGAHCASTTTGSIPAATSAIKSFASAKATTTGSAATTGSKTSSAAASSTSKAGVAPNAAIPGAGLAVILALGAFVV